MTAEIGWALLILAAAYVTWKATRAIRDIRRARAQAAEDIAAIKARGPKPRSEHDRWDGAT